MIKYLGIGCGVLVLLAVVLVGVVPAFLDDTYDSETSLIIDAPPEQIYPRIARLEAWQSWCPWNPQTFPEMKSTYVGEEGVGNEWSWTDPAGNGRMKIISADPATGIHYEMFFGEIKSEGRVTMKKVGNGTEVTMGLKGDLTWVMRLARANIDSALKQEFDKGLQKLKTVVESGDGAPTTEAPK